jgi:voltage-gated potassium channel
VTLTPGVENQRIRKEFMRPAAIMAGVVLVGTLGYHVLEGWPWLDALFMTVITISTVGFGETHPLSTSGRLFTLLLILAGVGNLTFFFGTLTQFFASGGPAAYHRRAQMQRHLDHLRDHTIVCGYGRLGSAIVEQLRSQGVAVAVVERSAEVCAALAESADIACVQGNAEDDHVLRSVGIERAHALVAALDHDASNVFLCLSARVLNPNVVIYAKADDPATLQKLERAGANHGFSPSLVAGHRIAWQIMRPAVTDLIGIATERGATELAIEELRAGDQPQLLGRALRETPVWGQAELMVVAVRTAAGSVQFPPQPDYRLAADDRVVVMGRVESLAQAGVAAKT